MNTEIIYNGQTITNLFHIEKTQIGYGNWTIKSEFQTEDGQWHNLSAHTTDSRLIDEWNDAIADDDMEALNDVKLEALSYIVSKN